MRGVHRAWLPSYLDEFMWKEQWDSEEAFNNILTDIAMRYSLP